MSEETMFNNSTTTIQKIPFINVEVPIEGPTRRNSQEHVNVLCAEQQCAMVSIIQQAIGDGHIPWPPPPIEGGPPPSSSPPPHIRFVPFPNGITNLVVLAENEGNQGRVVFRIYGKGTETMIDRKHELESAILLSTVGIGAAPLVRFCNGVVSEYLPGVPLKPVQIRTSTTICQKICEKMARMHGCKPAIMATADSVQYMAACQRTTSFVQITKWLADVKSAADNIDGADQLGHIFDQLRAKIVAFRLPIVFSHNDLLGYNILFDGGREVHFIDYEYAGMNFQFYDFANLFWEYSDDANCASDEEIGMYLRSYFHHFEGRAPADGRIAGGIHQVHTFEALTHLFWCLWALRQSRLSTLDFNYLEYAKLRQRRLMAAMKKCDQQELSHCALTSSSSPFCPIRYVSTRGKAPEVGFCDVLLNGLAPDGGLYMPSFYPKLSTARLRALRGVPYDELAYAIMAPYIVGGPADEQHDLELASLRQMLGQVYAGPSSPFTHPAICPLVQIGHNKFLLELFHGPTLAFKDFAMQMLARLMDHVLERRGLRATVIGATSGDTGGAAIHAFAALNSLQTFVLFPEGRISDFQRRQMTTQTAPNAHAVSIAGTFDDCQRLIKEMFADGQLRQQLGLTTVNSINWARILPQVVYYFAAALALGAPERRVSFVVPTGNFGNIFAGYVAKQMGLPIERLVIATNENDVLVRALASGIYEPGTTVRPTQSPSMDIALSSNFERLLFEACGRDGQQIEQAYATLTSSGQFRIAPDAHERILADFDFGSATEADTAATIAHTFAHCGYMADPHTAVGIKVAQNVLETNCCHSPMKPPAAVVILSTAHPAKFPEPIMAACGGQPPKIPPKFNGILTADEHAVMLPNQLDALIGLVNEKAARAL